MQPIFVDVNVQVAALIAMECLLTAEPVVPETKKCLLQSALNASNEAAAVSEDLMYNSKHSFDYVECSSDEEKDTNNGHPQLHIPWILGNCLSNLGVNHSYDKVSNIQLDHFNFSSSLCQKMSMSEKLAIC